MSDRSVVVGTISSVGFADGHRAAVGCWTTTPIGPFADVMWVTPDDRRTLLAPDDRVADFITAIYDFDAVRTGPVEAISDGRSTRVRALGVELDLLGGRRHTIPIPRPRFVTRYLEAPIARRWMGVHTYGVSPTGAREWYQARAWRWVVDGRGSVDSCDLGPPGPIERPLRVGFSEPPRRPSIVSVRVTIEHPAPGSGAGVG